MNNEVTTQTENPRLMQQFADQYSMDPLVMMNILRETAFRQANDKPVITDAQLAQLVVIANEYKLNPFTREIYAFPKDGGIVPIVGVDGWSRLVNQHPEFDGVEFEQDDQSCTCIMHRKDRSHPVSVTEYLSECKRSTGPWGSHPKRMLRHKAFVQCARLAFSYVGIFDEDEAERIRDVTPGGSERTRKPKDLPAIDADAFVLKLDEWRSIVAEGSLQPDAILASANTKWSLTAAQIRLIEDLAVIDGEVA